MTRLRLSAPSYGGNAVYAHAGGRRFGFPPGTRTHTARGGEVLWVAMADGAIHVFVAGGEVTPVPQPLQQLVRERIFGQTVAT